MSVSLSFSQTSCNHKCYEVFRPSVKIVGGGKVGRVRVQICSPFRENNVSFIDQCKRVNVILIPDDKKLLY